MKPCKTGYERNPKTKRCRKCRKIKKMNLSGHTTLKKQHRLTPKMNNTPQTTKLEYITIVRLRLKEITQLDHPYATIKNKFNNNAIYAVFLTIKKVHELMASGENDMSTILQQIGSNELFSHANAIIKKYNTYHKSSFMFLPATEFEKILSYQNLNMNATNTTELNIVIDYLVAELYNQIGKSNTQSINIIKKKDDMINHWLNTIGFKEIKSDALESKELMDAIAM